MSRLGPVRGHPSVIFESVEALSGVVSEGTPAKPSKVIRAGDGEVMPNTCGLRVETVGQVCTILSGKAEDRHSLSDLALEGPKCIRVLARPATHSRISWMVIYVCLWSGLPGECETSFSQLGRNRL